MKTLKFKVLIILCLAICGLFEGVYCGILYSLGKEWINPVTVSIAVPMTMLLIIILIIWNEIWPFPLFKSENLPFKDRRDLQEVHR